MFETENPIIKKKKRTKMKNSNISGYLKKHQNCLFNFKFQRLKLVGQFVYLSSNISSTESDVSIHNGNSWTSIKKIFDLYDKIKWEFSKSVKMSLLLYGCTSWNFKTCLENS